MGVICNYFWDDDYKEEMNLYLGTIIGLYLIDPFGAIIYGILYSNGLINEENSPLILGTILGLWIVKKYFTADKGFKATK